VTLSWWIGPPAGPARSARDADVPYYAASTMKVAVLAALYRSGLDLDAPVEVVDEHDSAVGGGARYRNDRGYDDEDQVWTRLGATAPARWLARRMIVRSSNLATNLLLARVGRPAVAEVWRLAGATGSVTARGIEDYAARDAGLDNVVTAADLAALFGALHRGVLAGPDPSAEMLGLLADQEWRGDLARGVPPGVRVAHKNGWMTGIRHSAGIVYPPDAPPYVVAACSGYAEPVTDAEACARIAGLSAEAWAGRHG
jgi:beta-lactamase class A